MVLLVEYIFLTIFYGLYFNHQFLHITLYNFSSSFFTALLPIVVTKIPWGHHAPAQSPISQARLRVLFQGVNLLHGLPWSTNCVEPRFYAAPFKFEFDQLLIFIEKLLPLPRFEPGTSPVPSWYPGLSLYPISLARTDFVLNLTESKHQN